MRRNGFLAFRPNVDKGMFERCDDQPWAQDFKQGCHRVENSWTENRHCFLDPAGKPLEPDWKGSGCGVRNLEDMEDAEQHGPEGSAVKLSFLKEKYPNGIEQISIELDGDVDISEELPEMGSGLMWILEQARAERKINIDPHLTSQRKPGQASKKLIEKQHKRAKIHQALKIFLPEWRSQARADGLKYSRRQLLEALVPKAGEKAKAASLLSEAKKSSKKSPRAC